MKKLRSLLGYNWDMLVGRKIRQWSDGVKFVGRVAAECWRRAIASPGGQLFVGFVIVCVVVALFALYTEHLETTVSPEAADTFMLRCFYGYGAIIVLFFGLVAMAKIVAVAKEVKRSGPK